MHSASGLALVSTYGTLYNSKTAIYSSHGAYPIDTGSFKPKKVHKAQCLRAAVSLSIWRVNIEGRDLKVMKHKPYSLSSQKKQLQEYLD